MTLIEQIDGLRIHIHSVNHELTPMERDIIETGLDRLRDRVDAFEPVDLDFQIIYRAYTNRFHVTLSLHLPERNLFTGIRGADLLEALESALEKLLGKLDNAERPVEAAAM